MTTKVLIRSPAPNHQDLRISTVDTETGATGPEHFLTDGQEIELYVYGRQELVIRETPKEAAQAAAEAAAG
jgi:hypothetical protein